MKLQEWPTRLREWNICGFLALTNRGRRHLSGRIQCTAKPAAVCRIFGDSSLPTSLRNRYHAHPGEIRPKYTGESFPDAVPPPWLEPSRRRRCYVASSHLWPVYGPGIFRSQFLDPMGRHNLIVSDADCRFLAIAPVMTLSEACRVAGDLRLWLEDPTQPLPSGAVMSSHLRLDLPRRWSARGI